jgi:hypothetical protein
MHLIQATVGHNLNIKDDEKRNIIFGRSAAGSSDGAYRMLQGIFKQDI